MVVVVRRGRGRLVGRRIRGALHASGVMVLFGADEVSPLMIMVREIDQHSGEGVRRMAMTRGVQQPIDGGDWGLDDKQRHEHGRERRHDPTQPTVHARNHKLPSTFKVWPIVARPGPNGNGGESDEGPQGHCVRSRRRQAQGAF